MSDRDTPIGEARRGAPGRSAQLERRMSVTSRRILVIDDEPDLVTALKYGLELWGHDVEVAYDGEGGICKALQTHPEVILCDIDLPGATDGLSVAETLKASALLEPPFMIAITGLGGPEDVKRVVSAGFDLHVTKPADLRVILRVIAELFGDDDLPTDSGPLGRARAGPARAVDPNGDEPMHHSQSEGP